jgi:hypothetical protein
MVWDVGLSAETVKCASKVILLTSVKKNFYRLRNLVNASKEPVDTAFYSRDPIMYSQKNETR